MMSYEKPKPEPGFTHLLLDLETKQVGCVLLQAAFGGDKYFPHRVPTERWFVSPTPEMRMYKVPNEEVEKIVESMNRKKVPV